MLFFFDWSEGVCFFIVREDDAMPRIRLIDGWQHYRGSLGGVWEVWRADKHSNHFNVPWYSVFVPHCYNIYADCPQDGAESIRKYDEYPMAVKRPRWYSCDQWREA
jgi:hypothetical protein